MILVYFAPTLTSVTPCGPNAARVYKTGVYQIPPHPVSPGAAKLLQFGPYTDPTPTPEPPIPALGNLANH